MTTPKPRASSDTSRSAPDPTTTRVRDELIAKIKAQIAAGGWTQQKAAELSGLTQPRISDLLRGNTSRFSLDALVSISAALERHSSTTEGGTTEYPEADGRHLVAEFMARLAARPVKGRYPAATENSTTERGGKLIATSGFSTIGGRVAVVGGIARYADGSEARMVCGAGVAALYEGRPLAWWAASWTTVTASPARFTTAWLSCSTPTKRRSQVCSIPPTFPRSPKQANHDSAIRGQGREDQSRRHGHQRRFHQRHPRQGDGPRGRHGGLSQVQRRVRDQLGRT